MTVAAQLMAGKKGLIMGVANDRSIAWGIAKACMRGADWPSPTRATRWRSACGRWPRSAASCSILRRHRRRQHRCAFAAVEKNWGELDFLVHAIAFSDKDQLKGRYFDTTRENFCGPWTSPASLHRVAQRAEPLMTNGGSLLTLTYYGAERVMPHYNVMGVAKAALEASVRYLAADLGPQNIRVNAISAGPIKTLAAAGIGDFRYILKWNELNAPMERNVEPEEVGNSGLYLLSDLAAASPAKCSCRLRLSRCRHAEGRVRAANRRDARQLEGA